jgi:mannose-6-phosphate isomerase-like protein (cupin superfamily)
MEFRDRGVWVEEGEFIVVSRGVEHRTVAEEKAHVMLFELASTLNSGTFEANCPRRSWSGSERRMQ